MHFHQITYGLLAGLTPILVLANSLLVSSESSPVQAWQPLLMTDALMVSEPITMVNAYTAMPVPTVSAAAPASIVTKNGQPHLEFYHSLNTAHQTPNMLVILDQQPVPIDPFTADGDRTVVLGKLQPTAGKQSYPIPTSVDVSQYLSMVIWCPELHVMMGYAPLSLQS